jgi:hypothetical protein
VISVAWSAVALLTGAVVGWPVAPGDTQHPIRGSFLDPRPDGFHIGVDISVRDDEPEPGAPAGRTHRVYAVEGGTVVLPPNVARVGCVNRRVDVGTFAYVHVDPIGVVAQGQSVAPGQLLGWTCRNLWHVHLSERGLVGGRTVWIDPLRPGGKLVPRADALPPRIAAIRFFTPARTVWRLENAALVADPAGRELPASGLRGTVDARALVSDPQSFRGFYADAFPQLYADLHPPRLRIELVRVRDGRRLLARDVYRAESALTNADLPSRRPRTALAVHYAPGTRQNVGAQPCLAAGAESCAGRYWLRLFARPEGAYWNTRLVRNGRYRLVARAWDSAGNAGARSVTVTVRNQ